MREPITVFVYVSGGCVDRITTTLANPDGALRVVLVDYDFGKNAAPECYSDDGATVLDDGPAFVGDLEVLPWDTEVPALLAHAYGEGED